MYAQKVSLEYSYTTRRKNCVLYVHCHSKKEKVVVVFFFYRGLESICSLMLLQRARVVDAYKVAREIAVVRQMNTIYKIINLFFSVRDMIPIQYICQ